MDYILTGKVISLFLVFSYGGAYAVKWTRGQAIGEFIALLATTGIVGFITLQWLI